MRIDSDPGVAVHVDGCRVPDIRVTIQISDVVHGVISSLAGRWVETASVYMKPRDIGAARRGVSGRDRTGVCGFADRCLATRPRRQCLSEGDARGISLGYRRFCSAAVHLEAKTVRLERHHFTDLQLVAGVSLQVELVQDRGQGQHHLV